MFIVIVDAHSKWLDVALVTTPSSQQAIKILRNLFVTHGLPEMVVSDNGSAFTSAEFQTFVKRNGIRHVRSALIIHHLMDKRREWSRPSRRPF